MNVTSRVCTEIKQITNIAQISRFFLFQTSNVTKTSANLTKITLKKYRRAYIFTEIRDCSHRICEISPKKTANVTKKLPQRKQMWTLRAEKGILNSIELRVPANACLETCI